MHVLAFNGSPRSSGNTSTIVDTILEGARQGGAETTHVVLDQLDLKGCQGCLSCRDNPGHCARRDGLSPYLEMLRESDGVVVGCPVYMYHVSGQMKLLVDRMYSFWEDLEDGSYRPALPGGKRFALVTSQGHPDPARYERAMRWLGGMVGGLGMETVGTIVHANSHDRPARHDAALLDRARRIGLRLAGVATSDQAQASLNSSTQ
jgi:multimeric flavodoxin WrbA